MRLNWGSIFDEQGEIRAEFGRDGKALAISSGLEQGTPPPKTITPAQFRALTKKQHGIEERDAVPSCRQYWTMAAELPALGVTGVKGATLIPAPETLTWGEMLACIEAGIEEAKDNGLLVSRREVVVRSREDLLSCGAITLTSSSGSSLLDSGIVTRSEWSVAAKRRLDLRTERDIQEILNAADVKAALERIREREFDRRLIWNDDGAYSDGQAAAEMARWRVLDREQMAEQHAEQLHREAVGRMATEKEKDELNKELMREVADLATQGVLDERLSTLALEVIVGKAKEKQRGSPTADALIKVVEAADVSAALVKVGF